MGLHLLSLIPASLGIFLVLSFYFYVPEQDQTFLYEHMRSNDNELAYQKDVARHPLYSTHYSLNHELHSPKEFFTRPKEEKLIIFMIVGTHGSYIQLPPVVNSLNNYTDILTHESKDTHYKLYSYQFEMKEQPSAFSKAVMQDQARYIAKSISFIMNKFFDPSDKFSILGHSIGGSIAYLVTQSKYFPMEQLSSIFALVTPLGESPQMISQGIVDYINKISSSYNEYLWNNVSHFAFHGGARDLLVQPDLTHFGRFKNGTSSLKNTLKVESTQLKNVYQSLDHNSFYYYKFLWDQLASVFIEAMLQSDSTPEKRISLAQNMLKMNVMKEYKELSLSTINYAEDFNSDSSIILENENKEHLSIFKDLKDFMQKRKRFNLKFDLKGNKKSLLLQTNIDRTYQVSLYLEKGKEVRQVLVEEFNQRIFYKEANLYAIEINVEALQSWESLIIEFQKVKEDFWKKRIMNLSPCTDKWNPILYPIFKEKNPYFYLTESSNRETTLSLPFPLPTAIQIPADICLKKALSPIQQIAVGVAWDPDMPEMFFLSKDKPCISTYPNRLKTNIPTLKVFGTHSLADLTISPNLAILLRESAFHNIFVIFGQTVLFCMISYHETRERQFSFRRLLQQFPIYYVVGTVSLLLHLVFKEHTLQIVELITNTKTQYYRENQDSTYAYFDILVIPVVSYTFVFCINGIYKGMQLLSSLLFNNRVVASSKHFTGFLHLLLIAIVCLQMTSSFQFHFHLALMIGLALLTFDMMLRKNYQTNSKSFPDPAFTFPLILYMLLLSDKFFLEVWRVQRTNDRYDFLDFHYQQNESNEVLPIYILMVVGLFVPLNRLSNAWFWEACLSFVPLIFGLLITGPFPFVLRPVFYWLQWARVGLYCVLSIFGKPKEKQD